MTDEMILLAKRAVACKGWRWMAGMKGEYPAESVAVRVHGVGVGLDPYCDAFALHSCRRFNVPISRLHDPDLTDPATLGCLLALVREAWSCDVGQVWLQWYSPLRCWGVRGGHAGMRDVLLASGATESEALVDALEATL